MEYEAARRRHMGPVMDHQAAYGGQGGLPTQASLGRGGPYPSMDANGKAVYRNRQEEMRDPDFHRPRCVSILFVIRVVSCQRLTSRKHGTQSDSRPSPVRAGGLLKLGKQGWQHDGSRLVSALVNQKQGSRMRQAREKNSTYEDGGAESSCFVSVLAIISVERSLQHLHDCCRMGQHQSGMHPAEADRFRGSLPGAYFGEVSHFDCRFNPTPDMS